VRANSARLSCTLRSPEVSRKRDREDEDTKRTERIRNLGPGIFPAAIQGPRHNSKRFHVIASRGVVETEPNFGPCVACQTSQSSPHRQWYDRLTVTFYMCTPRAAVVDQSGEPGTMVHARLVPSPIPTGYNGAARCSERRRGFRPRTSVQSSAR
jgi:hypothetical protein